MDFLRYYTEEGFLLSLHRKLHIVGPGRIQILQPQTYLPEALVRKGFALGVLDLGGLRETILSWSAGPRRSPHLIFRNRSMVRKV